jgi:hypothetical protein
MCKRGRDIGEITTARWQVGGENDREKIEPGTHLVQQALLELVLVKETLGREKWVVTRLQANRVSDK